jgi:hypothetical protein
VPTSVSIESFESELEQLVLSWVFEAYPGPVQATLTIEYVEPPSPRKPNKPKGPKPQPPDKPPDWHMCEMMMEPME